MKIIDGLFHLYSRMMSNSINVSVEGILFSFFISSTLYCYLFSKIISSYSFPLMNFADRAIGIAVVSAIDAQSRTYLYIESIIFR